MTIAFLCHAGERRMIKQFDKAGLKELNNQLKKQEKLIQKLTKQLQAGGTILNGKTVQTQDDFVSETVLEGAGTVTETVPAVGIAREDGRLELYTNEDENDIINIEPTSYVHETQAKIAVPSSYFLDLRGTWLSTSTQKYTADVAILHDTSGNTVTLTSVDETNDINDVQTASVAGKRDQADAFDASSWLHFFFIYNPATQDVSSLSSLSPTAPTLPTGYTYFVRVGAVYFSAASELVRNIQIGDESFINIQSGAVFANQAVTTPGTYQSVSIASEIPATAKIVNGMMGCTDATAGLQGMNVASDSSGAIIVEKITASPGSAAFGYGHVDAYKFRLPIITAQTLYWTGESAAAIYGLVILSFIDDL